MRWFDSVAVMSVFNVGLSAKTIFSKSLQPDILTFYNFASFQKSPHTQNRKALEFPGFCDNRQTYNLYVILSVS
jgi:hypothetical protein